MVFGTILKTPTGTIFGMMNQMPMPATQKLGLDLLAGMFVALHLPPQYPSQVPLQTNKIYLRRMVCRAENKQRKMKMSNKPRTETQKIRRKYLEDCKKNGINPMPIDDWKAKRANKTSKPSCKRVKSAKKVCDKKPAKSITKKGRKVIVERGDLVIFKDYKPCEIMRLAILMLVDVYKNICANNSRHNHNS